MGADAAFTDLDGEGSGYLAKSKLLTRLFEVAESNSSFKPFVQQVWDLDIIIDYGDYRELLDAYFTQKKQKIDLKVQQAVQEEQSRVSEEIQAEEETQEKVVVEGSSGSEDIAALAVQAFQKEDPDRFEFAPKVRILPHLNELADAHPQLQS